MRAIEDGAQWDAILLRLGGCANGGPPPHVLQSWAWGELKGRWGWSVARFAWGSEHSEWAAVQVMCRPVGHTKVGVGYASKGPFVLAADELLAANGQGAGRWTTVLADLEAWARARGLAVLKIDPDVPADRTDLALEWRSRGWRRSDDQIQFPNTMRSVMPAVPTAPQPPRDPPTVYGPSLSQAGPHTLDAALMAAYKPKTRYNVRLAERRGVRVRRGGAADIETFLSLYATTAQRQGFGIRVADYYRDVWATFLAAESATVVLAERDGRALAGAIPVRFGPTAWYLYGASSDEDRADMAPYAVLHDCLRWSAENGCTTFDWWGGPTAWTDADPLAGVGRFKEGFGAIWAPQLGAWDFAARPATAFGLRTLGRARRMWLRRRTGGTA